MGGKKTVYYDSATNRGGQMRSNVKWLGLEPCVAEDVQGVDWDVEVRKSSVKNPSKENRGLILCLYRFQ